MSLTQTDLIGARDAARKLLDRVGLRNYLFEVESRPGEWGVHVEYARDGAWHEKTLVAPERDLLASLDDDGLREVIARRWRGELGLRDAA